MITRETAAAAAALYREIESAEKLLAEVDVELKKDDSIDWHGFPQPGGKNCELGWPMGRDSHRCYFVEPKLARAVLMAHIADQKAKLEKLNEVARLEILGAN